MPKAGKILQFPVRKADVELSTAESLLIARRYLDTPREERSARKDEDIFSNPEILIALLQLLRDVTDVSPALAADEGERIFRFLARPEGRIGLFDEKDYFAGSAALLAGGANRLLGNRDGAEAWFDRADAAFRHIVNSGPSLANVAYARSTLHYDRRSYARVFEQIPSVIRSFERFGMKREKLKALFLEAATLKETSRMDEAFRKLAVLNDDPDLAREHRLAALVAANLAEMYSSRGRFDEAAACCEKAIALQAGEKHPLTMGHLKAVAADAFRGRGELGKAVDMFRAAVNDYTEAGMAGLACYLRVLTAESLIAADRPREAEWEILAALPTIEEQKMVPEGFAAVALLKESVRRRKTDPNALRELREHLQANR